MFYDDDIIIDRSNKYNEFLLNSDKVKNMYKKISEEYNSFKESTGLIFSDMTSNNILVNSDITDFRIIDINSITSPNSAGILGELNIKYVLGYYGYEHVVNNFFDKSTVDKLLEGIG